VLLVLAGIHPCGPADIIEKTCVSLEWDLEAKAKKSEGISDSMSCPSLGK